jgi:hypothetical protein
MTHDNNNADRLVPYHEEEEGEKSKAIPLAASLSLTRPLTAVLRRREVNHG